RAILLVPTPLREALRTHRAHAHYGRSLGDGTSPNGRDVAPLRAVLRDHPPPLEALTTQRTRPRWHGPLRMLATLIIKRQLRHPTPIAAVQGVRAIRHEAHATLGTLTLDGLTPTQPFT